MARGRPHGRSKSDHRVCQAARYARAAEYREKITINSEQQEARIAAVNAECNVEDAPRRRRRQKSRESKTKAGAARVSAGGRSRKASGSAKKKAKKGLEHALRKAAERDAHALYCNECGATAEFGLRGGKEGGKVKFVCRGHVHSTGCFRMDRDRADWAEDREMRRLRAEERRLEEELRNLGGASFTAKPPYASEKSQSAGSGASMPMSRSLLATLLLIGGIERNPGPAANEGSLDKGTPALQGRNNTGCSRAPGSIVGSGRPPHLLPSLEALTPTHATSGNGRVSHADSGLDRLAGLPERVDSGGQTCQLHLRLRGGADDEPMAEAHIDKPALIRIQLRGTSERVSIDPPRFREEVLEFIKDDARWGEGVIAKLRNGEEVACLKKDPLLAGDYIFTAFEVAVSSPITRQGAVTPPLDIHIADLQQQFSLQAIDFEKLQSVADKRAQAKIIPTTGDVINNVGSFFPWEERDVVAQEVYESQFHKWQKAQESQKECPQEETGNRDYTYEVFMGQRGVGKTAFARMLPYLLVKIAEERAAREGADNMERIFAKSIIASYKGQKKFNFHLDFSQPANRPNETLKDTLGEAALLAVLLLRGALMAWYRNVPDLATLCNWVSKRPGLAERVTVQGVLGWCAKHFPNEDAASLHCLIVMDEVHALDDSERAVFKGLNSLFTTIKGTATGIPFACWCLCTTTFDPDLEPVPLVRKKRKRSDPSVHSPEKKRSKGAQSGSMDSRSYELVPAGNNLIYHSATLSGVHLGTIHTIRPFTPEATQRIVVQSFRRMGVLAEDGALPPFLEIFFAGSGLGRDVAAGMTALAMAKENEKVGTAQSTLNTLHVEMLKAFVNEQPTAPSLQAAEDYWTLLIVHRNGTLTAQWLDELEEKDRLEYVQAIITKNLAGRTVGFNDYVIKGTNFSYGWFFMMGLYSLLATGPPVDLAKARLKLEVPPKHLEIFAAYRKDSHGMLSLQHLYRETFRCRENPDDKEWGDLNAIKSKSSSLYHSGYKVVCVGEVLGSERRDGVFNTRIRVPKDGYWHNNHLGRELTDEEYQGMLKGDLPHGWHLMAKRMAHSTDWLAVFELDDEPGQYFAFQGQTKEHILKQREKKTGAELLELVTKRPVEKGVVKLSEWDKRWKGPEDRFVFVFSTDHEHDGTSEMPKHANIFIVDASRHKQFYGDGPSRRRDLVHTIMEAEYVLSERAKREEERKRLKAEEEQGEKGKKATRNDEEGEDGKEKRMASAPKRKQDSAAVGEDSTRKRGKAAQDQGRTKTAADVLPPRRTSRRLANEKTKEEGGAGLVEEEGDVNVTSWDMELGQQNEDWLQSKKPNVATASRETDPAKEVSQGASQGDSQGDGKGDEETERPRRPLRRRAKETRGCQTSSEGGLQKIPDANAGGQAGVKTTECETKGRKTQQAQEMEGRQTSGKRGSGKNPSAKAKGKVGHKRKAEFETTGGARDQALPLHLESIAEDEIEEMEPVSTDFN